MESVASILEELKRTLSETDDAHQEFAKSKQVVLDAKMEKYEQVENAQGDPIYVPLEVLMEQLRLNETASGQFKSQINGRSTKDERAAELENYMLTQVPAYQDYAERLQSQAIHEAMATGAALIAEKNYGRLHTKVMALRGQLEFMTEVERHNTAQIALDAEREHQQQENVNYTKIQRVEEIKTRQIAQQLEIEKLRNETAKTALRTVELEVQNVKEQIENEAKAKIDQAGAAVFASLRQTVEVAQKAFNASDNQ